MALLWFSRGLLSHLFGFVPVLLIWGTVGIDALVHAIRTMFWTRNPWVRLAAGLVLPAAVVMQIRACGTA
jgi:hypothetical protein